MRLLLAILLALSLTPAYAAFHGSPPAGQIVTAIAMNFVPQGNYTSGSGVIPSGNTLYFTGGCTSGTPIATLTPTVSGGGSYTGSYSLTGTNAASFQVSGSNLQCGTTVAAGSYSFNVVAGGNSFSQAVAAYAGATYYLSPTGSDSNGGTSGSPWLSPNHSVHCGDFLIMQASTSYNGTNFQGNFGGFGTTNKWVAATCPGNDNVAWIKCATFDACKFSTSGPQGLIEIAANYWGVQGIECDNVTEVTCFTADPPTTGANIHHIARADNVCNNAGSTTALSCVQVNSYGSGGGAQSWVDYIVDIGNLAYASAAGTSECGSGISWAATGDSDSNAGTHDYLAFNISWSNFDGAGCSGSGHTTDGEGFILDTPGLNSATGQVVVENNIFVGNGSSGFEEFTNITPAAGKQLPLLVRYNTLAGNSQDPARNAFQSWNISLAGDSANGYLVATVEHNLVSESLSTLDLGGTAYALGNQFLNPTASIVDINWLSGYGSPKQNIVNWDSPVTGNAYTCTSGSNPPGPGSGNSNTTSCANNVLSTDPVFTGSAYCTGSISSTTLTVSGCTGAALAANMQLGSNGATQIKQNTRIVSGSGSTWTVSVSQTVSSETMVFLPVPGAPSCGSAADTLACMSATLAAFVPTATNASNYGYGVTVADANNTTPFICNVERALPSDMNPHC